MHGLSARLSRLVIIALGVLHASLVVSAEEPFLPPGGGHEAIAEVSEPDGYRMDEYRTPVPKTLKGARVIHVEEAETLHAAKQALFIDVYPQAPKPPNLPTGTVWRDPTHMTIDGARWLPNVGYGTLSPEIESYFRTSLDRLSGGDKTKPLVFFCLKNCWMSWNAAKRAMTYGYATVIWFPEGTDAWQEAGNDLVKAVKE